MVACVEYDEFIIEYYMFCSHFAVLLVLVSNLLTPICQLITDFILPPHF